MGVICEKETLRAGQEENMRLYLPSLVFCFHK